MSSNSTHSQIENTIKTSKALCWMQGEILPAEQATISVYDHGLLYGDGIFEGLRFYNNKVFKLNEHLERLQVSANAISLNIPLSSAELKNAITLLISEYENNDGYLRLVITRGKGSLGIDPKKCAHPQCFIIIDELSVMDSDHDEGVKAIFSKTKQKSLEGINPSIKSLNYLNNILARIEANVAGADESIMLNDKNEVTEGCVDNIFIVKDGVLKTPTLTCGLLAGITRQTIMDLAYKRNIEVDECVLLVDDILTADECFLTGTGAELIAVKQIEGVTFQADRKIYKMLSHDFKVYILNECA